MLHRPCFVGVWITVVVLIVPCTTTKIHYSVHHHEHFGVDRDPDTDSETGLREKRDIEEEKVIHEERFEVFDDDDDYADIFGRPGRSIDLEDITESTPEPPKSLYERFFIYILFGIFVSSATLFCVSTYSVCCSKAIPCTCCCRWCVRHVANKYMVGMEVDDKGNVQYHEITEEEKEALGDTGIADYIM